MPKSTAISAAITATSTNTIKNIPTTTSATTSIKQANKTTKKKTKASSKLPKAATVIKKPDKVKKFKKSKKKQSKSKSRARKLDRTIKLEQVSKTSAIKRASFSRQVKLVLSAHSKEGSTPLRITPKAIAALQEATEQHLVERFCDALAIANRHDKVTPTDVDLRLVCSLKPIVGHSSSSNDIGGAGLY